jgi:hypothetical protein
MSEPRSLVRLESEPPSFGVPRPWPPARIGKVSCAFRSSPVPSRCTPPPRNPRRSRSTSSTGRPAIGSGHWIKYAKVDADTGEEVANEDIVKGYKIDTDTFVEVTKEELENEGGRGEEADGKVAPEVGLAAVQHPVTPDGRYFVVRGRLWRMANPGLDETERSDLVQQLGAARRAVRDAKQSADREAKAAAHKVVDEVKRSLDERGPVWWGDGARRISTDTWRRIRPTPNGTRKSGGLAEEDS